MIPLLAVAIFLGILTVIAVGLAVAGVTLGSTNRGQINQLLAQSPTGAAGVSDFRAAHSNKPVREAQA